MVMASSPRVSVIMPVFNGAAYLAEAMDSILAQTLTDIELIVIDDGSADDTVAIVRSYADPRVRFLQNPHNLGLPVTRNRGIAEARGDYIAFLDSDDIALPRRLQEQVEYLDANPNIAGLGASAQPINAQGEVTGPDWRCPGEPEFCKAMLLFRAYLITSTFMARTPILQQIHFDITIALAEDFNLYNRLCEQHRLRNLPQTLIKFRVHPNSTTATRKQALREAIGGINRRQLAALGLAANDQELRLHRHIEWLDMIPSEALLAEVSAWLLRLIKQNERYAIYDRPALRQAAASRWHAVCEDALRKGNRAGWLAFYRSPLRHGRVMALKDHLKLSARLLTPRRPRRLGA
jgi:glycosyltransferase involved in cell wall biosynthesis